VRLVAIVVKKILMFLLLCKEVELMKRLKEEEAITEMEAITLADTGILRKEGLKDDHVQDH